MKRAAGKTTSSAAWGLELTQASAQLVQLERTATDAVIVPHRQTYSVGDFWNSGTLNGELGAALSQVPRDQPLAICFPDRSMLCRSIELPKTTAAATSKMVQSQAEAIFGGAGDDRLSWTWQNSNGSADSPMQSVLLCAAQRSLLEQIRRAVPGDLTLRVLLPRMLAVAPQTASGLVIELSDHAATLALVVDGQLRRCVVVDRDSDDSLWARQVRQSYQSLLEGLPRERWPQQGVMRANENESVATVCEAISNALGIQLRVEPSESAAEAAARLALQDAAAPTVNFAATQDVEAGESAVRPGRIAVVGAACLLAILVMYGLDEWRAHWLSQQIDQLHAVESSSSGIERRLAVDRYLEKNASPALPGLDAILASAPPSLQMNSLGLNAAGQFHLAGIVQAPNEVDEFLRKLQDSKVLTNVQLRSARNDQNRWSVELTVDAAPMAGLLLNSPKPVTTAAPPPSPRGGA